MPAGPARHSRIFDAGLSKSGQAVRIFSFWPFSHFRPARKQWRHNVLQ
jgi:hypothetical protein